MSRSNSGRAAHIRAESSAIQHTEMLLEAVRHERAEADRHLRVAQQRADDLATQQIQLEARLLYMHKTVLALRADYMQESLNSCPDDVLRCIFDVAVDSPGQDWKTFGFGCYDHNHAALPFALASVCSRWRRVALRCPRLWTNIAIPDPPLTIADVKRVDILLERSSPCAIDILFDRDWQDYEPYDLDGPLHRCIASLSQHSARWRRVQVWLLQKASIDVLNVLRGPLPLLAELSLTISMDDLETDTRTQKTFLPFAPCLQKLDIAFAGFDIANPDHPGFRSLLNLRCWGDLSPDQVARLISLSKTTLQHLDVEPSGTVLPFPLTMPDLQSLCIRGRPFFAQWPPSGLLLPRLTTLALCSSMVFPELEPFLEHISPTVTHLDLFGHVWGATLDVVKHLTNVAHLAIVRLVPDAWGNVEGDFFLKLADAVPCIWPKLMSVRIDASATLRPSNEEGILRLVNSRTKGRSKDAQLRQVVINYEDKPQWLIAEVARLLAASQ